MAKPKNIILTEEGVITQEALLAYAQGRLSPEEVAQVDKLLRDDPFAQEALDGIRNSAAAAGMDTAVTAINSRLREKAGMREKKRKGIEIHWATYAYAATIVGVLLGLGFVMVHFIQQNDHAIALNKAVPQAEESVPAQEQKTEAAPVITDTMVKTEVPDKQAALNDTSQIATQTTVALNTPPAGTATVSGSTAQTPATGQMRDQTAVITNSFKPAATEKKTPVQTSNPGSAVAKPAAPPVAKEADDIAYSVDGHDLNTGAEIKSKNYKSTTPADFDANRGLSSTTVMEAVNKNASKKEKAAASAVDQMKEARALFDAGDFKEAAKRYDKVLSNQPENIDALFFGGICEYKNGRLKPAEKNFDKLIKSGQYVDGSKWYKANVLIDRGKKDEAKQLLKELSTTPNPYKDRAVKKYEEVQK